MNESVAGPRKARVLLLTCFFLSGFSALLYQIVWMRLSLAAFGVNTSVIATVLSMFMVGLAAGTLWGMRLLRYADTRFGLGPLRVYGLAELLVGVGGLTVPMLLSAGRQAMLTLGPADSIAYTIASQLILAGILLPFCTAMGLTVPSAIAFLRSAGATDENALPFSALYLANVLGAVIGSVVTPIFFIERYGFTATGRGAAIVNAAIAAAALSSFSKVRLVDTVPVPLANASTFDPSSRSRRLALFVTGFSTMGMELLWMRVYPPVIGTFVYSFAAIVAIYLLATLVGSAVYRSLRHRTLTGRIGVWFPWLGAASLFPLLAASVTFPHLYPFLRLAVALAPFCALLGFVTPALVDREAGDDPARVGAAYGINLIGCLLGPLFAGFILIPFMSAKIVGALLALPLVLLLLLPDVRHDGYAPATAAAIVTSGILLFSTHLFEDEFPASQVRRDHVATVVASGTGMEKNLFVNGVGMTVLTPITKMMAHLPLAHLAPQAGRRIDVLVICFGMGTTFRSLNSWGANVTAVDLVPSVPAMFGYFHEDGPELIRASAGRLHVVSDDGRRFLDRTSNRYDLITIDPPPPVAAAGSSLLYSKEFYASAKRKMKAGAILEAWLPGGDHETVAGVVASVLDSFPHVRVFQGVGGSGFQILASMTPIPAIDPKELLARMPAAAVTDMREWLDDPSEDPLTIMLTHEYEVDSLLTGHRRDATLAITDDRPVNEFYFLRRLAAINAAEASQSATAPP